MATWQLARPGSWDYASLGFSAVDGDILIASNAPDAFWNPIANGPAETVKRTGVGTGGDPGFVETEGGSILAYDDEANQYLPMRPADIAELPAVQEAFEATVDDRAATFLGSQPGVAAGAAAAVGTAMAEQYLSYALVYGTGSGTKTAAVVSGSPTYTAGKFGNALGGTACIATDAGSVPAPSASQVFTVEAWVKLAAPPTGIKVIAALGNFLSLTAAATSGFASFSLDGNTYTSSGVNICDGAWHQVALQFSRSGTTRTFGAFYVDGVPISGLTPSTASKGWTNLIYIGGFSTPNTFNWTGQIDELRVSKIARYSAAFTPATSPFAFDASTLVLAHLDDTSFRGLAGGYPVRPPGAPSGAVTYIGPTQPTDWLTDDRWVNNA